MRDLKTVLCRLHSRSQPRYPRFTLCPECRAEARFEAIVVEAVVHYFSEPPFREFFIETEHEIQFGSRNGFADVVLLDKSKGFVVIAECKQTGVVTYGREQLKSYLCATDTQFGVFANSKNPDEWEFYENLRRNRFTPPMGHSPFERKIATERTIESIRKEKNKIDWEIQEARNQYAQKIHEVDSSRKQLDELNEEIERKNKELTLKNKELTLIKGEVYLLRKESSDLKEKNTRLKKIARSVVSEKSRLDELKAAFDREYIYGQIREELERLGELESEIKSKQQLAQVLEEKESILKQLRVVVNQLKTASSEQQTSQIEENRRQLVQDLQKRECIRGKLIKEISRLKEAKSELKEGIRQEGQQPPFEENEVRPAYVQIQLEIDELKTEKFKIEAKIGHQIFLRLP